MKKYKDFRKSGRFRLSLSFGLAVEGDDRTRMMDAYWCLPPRRTGEANSRSPQPVRDK